jgi:hypothetical protein
LKKYAASHSKDRCKHNPANQSAAPVTAHETDAAVNASSFQPALEEMNKNNMKMIKAMVSSFSKAVRGKKAESDSD